MNRSEIIKQKALSLGLLACGIAKVRRLSEEDDHLRHYLGKKYQGGMNYMAKHFDMRLDPSLLVQGAKSIIVVLLNYFPQHLQKYNDSPVVAKYAYGADYHTVLKKKLNLLLDYIRLEIGPVQGRAFTDSAPILEKAWAVEAGLGWIGKNGMLINKSFGSFFFIGELIIDMELEYDQPYKTEHCGKCDQCMKACPTQAFVHPWILDSKKCISYLTIELKKEVQELFRPKLSNRVFGCDICQDICPWNRKKQPHNIEEFNPQEEFLEMDVESWRNLDKMQFKRLFKNSAIQRAGFEKLKQNIGYTYPDHMQGN